MYKYLRWFIILSAVLLLCLLGILLMPTLIDSNHQEDSFTMRTRKWRLDPDSSSFAPGVYVISSISHNQHTTPLAMMVWLEGDPPSVRVNESLSPKGIVYIGGIPFENLYPSKLLVVNVDGSFSVFEYKWKLDGDLLLNDDDIVRLIQFLLNNGYSIGQVGESSAVLSD